MTVRGAGRSGILFIDKPFGLTSHDVVSKARKAAGTKKVGHAGTLDPMATGLLVLGLNSSTRLLTFLVGLGKEYFATIRLGESTSTDDAQGELIEATDLSGVTDEQLLAEIARLTGEISQVPSSVSAIKVDGKRAYAIARAGETVELAPRTVTISAFEVLATRRDTGEGGRCIDVDVRVECSSGTYIRALARDLGAMLGGGGHLTALRRTRVGPFDIADAAQLDGIDVEARLVPPADVARALFPECTLSAEQVIDLVHGKRIRLPGYNADGPAAAIAPDGRLVGLITVAGNVARPIVNFPTDEVLP